MSVQRRKYDSYFKRNAVKLSGEPGRSVQDVVGNLGIAPDFLYRWRMEFCKTEIKFTFFCCFFEFLYFHNDYCTMNW